MSDFEKWSSEVSIRARLAAEEELEFYYPDESNRPRKLVMIQQAMIRLLGGSPNSEQIIELCMLLPDHPILLLFVVATRPYLLLREGSELLVQAIALHMNRLVKQLIRIGWCPNLFPERGTHPLKMAILASNVEGAMMLMRDTRFRIKHAAQILVCHRPKLPIQLFLLRRLSVFWMLVQGVRLPKVPWLSRDCLRLLICFL
jgi:hypothetical protein